MNKKLYKSRDKAVCGVCAGLADYLDIDVTVVRLVVFLLIFFGGLSLWAYIIAAIIIPDAPAYDDYNYYNNNPDNRNNI